MNPAERTRLLRWQLILGEGDQTLDECWAGRNQALSYLYDRDFAGGGRNERRGGMQDSQLTVPEWINQVHELFPRRTIERIEKDAIERYEIQEVVTNPEVLARAQPNQTLLKAVLRTKHLMNQEVLALARRLVRQVVDQLMERLARPIRQPFSGTLDRRRRSLIKVARNFDPQTTIRHNLRHYDSASRRLFIQTPWFNSRVRPVADRWQIIILVDQSGSMLDSVIHAAIMASVFHGIPALRQRLIAFDTAVVDLSEHCGDPVETLMKVQLGGGTDIGGALEYAEGLVENPRRTIMVLITDFEEGAPVDRLLKVTRRIVESGVCLLGLAALDDRACPTYDRKLAQRLVNLGASVGAMTPGELAQWIAQKVR
jgi:hypothetical protein